MALPCCLRWALPPSREPWTIQLSILEDCIRPTRHFAPWALPLLVALAFILPFIGVGVWYLFSLWTMQGSIPPFLCPIVIGITFIVVCVGIAALVALLLVVLAIVGITLDAQSARLARAALPERVRSRRSWHAVAIAVRLTALRAASGPGPRKSKDACHEWSWQEAWQKVAGARNRRKEGAAQDKLDIGGLIARGSSPVVVLACWATIAFEQYVFFFIVLPYFKLSQWCQILLLPPTTCVALRIFYDYAHVVFRSPGHPEPCGNEALAEVEGLPVAAEPQEKRKWCIHCNSWKPPRCHHCRICRRCVLKMDHHCMFVSNCVGRDNYRHFFLLLVGIVFGGVVLGLCLIPQVVTIFGDRKDSVLDRSIALVAFVIAALAMALLGPFLWYHTQLVLRNETTLEQMKRKQVESPLKRNKLMTKLVQTETLVSYSRSPLENFSEVFGMPPVWSRPALESALGLLTSRRSAKRSS